LRYGSSKGRANPAHAKRQNRPEKNDAISDIVRKINKNNDLRWLQTASKIAQRLSWRWLMTLMTYFHPAKNVRSFDGAWIKSSASCQRLDTSEMPVCNASQETGGLAAGCKPAMAGPVLDSRASGTLLPNFEAPSPRRKSFLGS